MGYYYGACREDTNNRVDKYLEIAMVGLILVGIITMLSSLVFAYYITFVNTEELEEQKEIVVEYDFV